MKFLELYKQDLEDDPGIRGRQMNAPTADNNGLGDIGLELEIEALQLPSEGLLEGIKGPVTGAHWKAKIDGSLRGESLEYILSTPCVMSELEPLLSGLWGKFSQKQTKFNLSNRCSTHVHINVGGKKLHELTTFISLWTIFEEALINWCGEERQLNHFCLPSSEASVAIDWWVRYLNGENNDLNENTMKYSALNICTMSSLGSFEIRTMRASATYRPILLWAKFVHALMKYSVTNPNPAVLAGIVSERTGISLFLDVCRVGGVPNEFSQQVLSLPENRGFNQLALNGLRRTQQLVLGYPWEKWIPMIEKEYVPNPFAKTKVYIRMPPPLREGIAPMPRFRARGEERQNARPPVNWDRPIMFGDGTPAEIVVGPRAVGGDYQVRAVPGAVPAAHNWLGMRLNETYFYDEDGSFGGTPRGHPYIVNVPEEGANPVGWLVGEDPEVEEFPDDWLEGDEEG